MTYEIKTIIPGHISDSEKIWMESVSVVSIGLTVKYRDDNYYRTFSAVSDKPIGKSCVGIDGNLIISSSWGEGVGINRINNDGTWTALYSDYSPTNTNYQTNFALHTGLNIFFSSRHNTSDIAKYDYSDLKTGGTGVVKTILTQAGDDLPDDKFGDAYINGFAIAGDYLYMNPYDNYVGGVYRYHIISGQIEYLETNGSNQNGARGGTYYFPDKDIIVQDKVSNGGVLVVTNASNHTGDPNPPKTYGIDTYPGIISYSNYIYFNGPLFGASENIMFIPVNYMYAKIDISGCFTGTGTQPTLIASTEDYAYPPFSINSRFCLYNSDTQNPNYIRYSSDRSKACIGGWLNTEDMILVGPIYGRYINEYFHHDGDPIRTDYGGRLYQIFSENNTEYWFNMGYGYDGGYIHVYTGLDDRLEPSGYVEFGPYKLSTDEYIVGLSTNLTSGMYTPSDTSYNLYASNDGGVNYFSMTGDNISFSTVGNEVYLKLELFASPSGISCAHYFSKNDIALVLYSERSLLEKNTSIKLLGAS